MNLIVTHTLVIRRGNECVAAVLCTGFDSQTRAEESLSKLREEHWETQSKHYRSWDEYCQANSWWITKVPLL